MQPTLIIMAAGMGSRFGGLKQLEGFGPNGERIIDYTIFDAARAGFGRVVFIIKEELRELFEQTVGSAAARRLPVDYVYQKTDDLPAGIALPKELDRQKPWGTGHALWCCRNSVKEPFAVVNADDYYGPDAFKQIAAFLSQPQGGPKAHYCMAGYVLENTLTENGSVARGVCEVSGNMLKSITEHTKITKASGCAKSALPDGSTVDLPLSSTVSMNCWGFTPDFFAHLERSLTAFLQNPETDLAKDECYLPAAASALVAQGKADVTVLKTTDRWYGVTYREDKPAVAAAIGKLAQTLYPPHLWE